MLTLYYAPGACSMAPHIALEEAGADYTAVRIDEAGGEHLTEAYRRINPRAKVPALKLGDGTVITENVAIQTYIARAHPAARLMPADPVGEARALSLMSFFATTVHPVFGRYYRPERSSDDPATYPSIKAKAREVFFDHLREIDALLAGRDWFFDRFSTVDAYAFVFYGWCERADLPVRELKHYSAHKERMLQRPAVQRVLAREGVSMS
ncbi:MAG TPA: glutathione S-transferase N-terminal domain-containing protein [Burkholderiales bacterium]|nr:glutathione S-transferase N-terminal domain-containing protein [Burkholderiales bacterium]